MKVLITGANGQLGSELCKVLDSFEIARCTHANLEITDLQSVRGIFAAFSPDIVINTAAYVRVDDCESNSDTAYMVNALGARNVAVAAQESGAKLVHLSTDYVFGGEQRSERVPYTEFDTPVAINIYGKSKLAGEELVRYLCLKHFIVRTSGLYGVAGSSGKGGNFVETILRLGQERDELKVVNDQVFSPTYARDLATKIAQLVMTDYYGVFHVTNRGTCSWYEFAKEILKVAGLKTKIVPLTSDQYPQEAKRPGYSVLENLHLRLLSMDDMRPWQDAIVAYMSERGAYKVKVEDSSTKGELLRNLKS